MDSDSARERMPSAIRLSASAASDGDAAPSNSNSLRSPIGPPLRGRDAYQRPPRPSNRDLHALPALSPLHVDVEQHELGRRHDNLVLAAEDTELAREQAPGEL